MKILNPFVILFTLYISSFLCRAQEVITSPKDWQEEVFQEGNDFKTMQVKFSEYWQDKEPGKGSGYKQFKRWEHEMEGRLDAEGNIVGPSHIWEEYTKYVSEHPTPKSSSSGTWQEIGPVSQPKHSGLASLGELGRVVDIAFHPTNRNIIYICTSLGGLWKSVDNGIHWENLTDELPFSGASNIEIDPLNPSTLYLALGERSIGLFVQPSLGVLKSTDGGDTWSTTGLVFGLTGEDDIESILDLAINPSNPDVLIAATTNGLYRTTNGGTTWNENIFEGDEYNKVKFHPTNPNVVYAAERFGPLMRSLSGGSAGSWVDITANVGITSPTYNMNLAVTPAAPNNLYIMTYENPAGSYNGFGGLYLSENQGNSFVKKSSSPNLLNTSSDGSGNGVAGSALAVSPTDEELILAGGGHIWKSTDQGSNWTIKSYNKVHVDQRYFAFNPLTGDFYSGNDGGLNRSTDNGETWELLGKNLGIGQVYRMGMDPNNSDRISVGFQDNGTSGLNSSGLWKRFGGGDGMENVYDPELSNYIYCSSQNGSIYRSSNGVNGLARAIITRFNIAGESGAWTTPFELDPDDANTMYVAYNNVRKNTNVRVGTFSTSTWTKITDFDPEVVRPMIDMEISDLEFKRGYISNYDTAFYTFNIAGPSSFWTGIVFPFDGNIQDMEAGTVNAMDVFVCRRGVLEDGAPNERVFRSTNGGLTWENISGTLPNYSAYALVQDKNTGVLYVGMEAGIYRYDDDSDDWVLFSTGLPNTKVNELEIYYDECNPEKNRLRAATYGRGTWESELFQPELQHKATLPYSTGFELGLDEFWTTHSEEGTLIETSGDYEPRTGTRSLVMASESIGSTQLRNDARLHLDLSDETQVELRFWWREYHDEYSTNAITGDGIYFSDDGGENFQKTPVILNGSNTNEWFEAVLDVDEIAEDLGLELNCNFVIKFQQIDNYPINLGTSSSDGLAFDDISVVSYAELPYYTGFDLGKFDQYWTSGSDVSNGVVEISTFESPVESHHLLMYSTENGTFAKNYADLHLNLEGVSDATLTFKWKDFGDEDHAEDAIYFSNNGGKDFEFIGNLWTRTNDTYVTKTYDVDFWATLRGLTLTDQFVIRFQQYDDYGLGWDGFAFDEINVFTGTGITESPFPITENAAAQNFEFILFPNPAKENITVVFNSDTEEQVEWSIYNIMGQQLITQNTTTLEGQNRIEIDLTTLINGTYFFKVTGQKTSTQKKFIIDK